jgi:hypothetical protein
MKILAHIMSVTCSYPVNCWWNNSYYNSIIDYAHKLELVYRFSTTQVHWTEKGIYLLSKYK